MKNVSAYLKNNNGGENLLENLKTHTKISVTNHEINSLIMIKEKIFLGVLRKRGCEREREP